MASLRTMVESSLELELKSDMCIRLGRSQINRFSSLHLSRTGSVFYAERVNSCFISEIHSPPMGHGR
jgi:hypothetical protein